MDALIADWQARIRAAAAARTPLRLRGGGSKDFYGEPPQGELLETGDYRGIIAYDPSELVITARCGTPLADLEAAMRERGQMLAFEPPHFAAGATLGGCVAAGLSGPRRPYAGAVRDLVLGIRAIDGHGQDLRFGGQVMKNVAGFDLARLATGSLGTLMLIAEVSLKCLPLPRAEATRGWELAADAAIRRINEWSGQPLPITASAWDAGRLVVRFGGAVAAIEAALARLGGDPVDGEAAYWQSLRDHTHEFFAGAPALWRLSVRATAAAADLGGPQLIEWGGALRWVRAGAADAARLRAWAAQNGGHATLFRSDGATHRNVFHPLTPAISALHRRLKMVFDPSGILNSGRLYPDL